MSQPTQEPRKVLIATPSYDGRLDVWYVNSVINSVRVCQANNIFLHPVFMSYDALVQRARNSLVSLALNQGYDDIIFIDSDMEFDPMWILKLLSYEEDVVGGTTRKKTDDEEIYSVKTRNLEKSDNGLLKVESLGTGFVKISRKALQDVYNISESYTDQDQSHRSVFEVKIIDGELYSEDTVFFVKLASLGYESWLDTSMTCVHIGTKKFYGDIESFIERLKVQ